MSSINIKEKIDRAIEHHIQTICSGAAQIFCRERATAANSKAQGILFPYRTIMLSAV